MKILLAILLGVVVLKIALLHLISSAYRKAIEAEEEAEKNEQTEIPNPKK